MPFDPVLAERLEVIVSNCSGMTETRMMGGFGYLLNGNMCMGIHRDTLIIRIGEDMAKKVLQEAYVRPMDFTGKVMKGWATVEPEAMQEDEGLKRFCEIAIGFVKTLPKK